jgi:galactonate dehydratase
MITNYELFKVPPRWLFLRLETSDGLVGWGEPLVEGRSRTVRAAVSELIDNFVLHEDPFDIQDLWQKMYRSGFYRGGPILMSAIAGIDQALWDIKGKHLDCPVYELLGGKARERVRVYQWIGGDQPSELADKAEQKVDEGFTAIKMNATNDLRHVDKPTRVEAATERLRTVRERVGPEIDIGIDFHGRVRKPMVKRLAQALEPYEPMFIEEPVLPEHNDALPGIASGTSVPLATGERMYSRWDFKQVFEDGAVDIVQPNPSHAGGITEVMKIASMAEAYDVALAPLCPLGPITHAVCLQIDVNVPNSLIQDLSLNIQYDGEGALNYLTDPGVFEYNDGFIEVPEGPGLGIELDEEYIRERADDSSKWNHPVWRHSDGSIAER